MGRYRVVDLRTAIGNAVRGYACRVLRNGQARDNLVQRTVRRIPGGGRVVDFAQNAGDSLENLVCGSGGGLQPPAPGDDFSGQRPFNGGQCPVQYNLTMDISGTRVSTGASILPVARSVSVNGPVRQIFKANPNLGDTLGGYVWGAVIQATSINSPNYPGGARVIENSTLGARLGVKAADPYQTGFLTGNGGGGNFIVSPINLQNINLIRVDGLPDDCGDVAPPLFGFPVTNITINYDNSVNTNVTIPINIGIVAANVKVYV